jgi:hypothetical protein
MAGDIFIFLKLSLIFLKDIFREIEEVLAGISPICGAKMAPLPNIALLKLLVIPDLQAPVSGPTQSIISFLFFYPTVFIQMRKTANSSKTTSGPESMIWFTRPLTAFLF